MNTTPSTLTASVIITTYNSTRALELVVTGYARQDRRDFELIIADDGSGEETRELVRRLRREIPVPLLHVWQPDEGFQKCRILNKAIVAARSDYLIISDGDCIPREDFVSAHLRSRKPGHYLSGALFRLSQAVTDRVTVEDVVSKSVFDPQWLVQRGQPRKTWKLLKLTRKPRLARFLERIATAPPSWNGANSSCWRSDAIEVNGFDERMRYGALDREFGVRLVNAGVVPTKIRYSAVCAHLEHKRSYNSEAGWELNRAIRSETANKKLKRTAFGLAAYLTTSISLLDD